ncbi:MAG: right-handed parallel beta-helix repeat-containing protein [Treponema sp.]|nr:right-handed parallel beta-helix repeat-containing protein [Treponema sp.]MCL2272933.1 right-handed parallel beta-helix repeat-containing protein [Treponema sp.]
MFKIKKIIIGLIISIITILLFTSQQTPGTNIQETRVSANRNTSLINGFRSHAANYEIVNLPQDRRTNVIKINGRDCDWTILSYQLDNYRDKWITIRFSADVMLTEAGENWQCNLNNEPDYPAVVRYYTPAVPGVWNRISGSLTAMPSHRYPCVFINTYGNDNKNTIYYFDNISVEIEVWDYAPASVLQTAGEAGSNNARNIYVSAGRRADGGNGTQSRPFQKIAHAMYYVKPGDTVLVDSGIYYEKIRIPSGSSERPVTLTAMPGAEVIITPTIPITPQWRQHTRNIFVADISQYVKDIDTEFPQLFADKDSMVEARFPNMGPSMSMIHDYMRDIAGRGTNKNTVIASRNIPSEITDARVVICPGINHLSWETASSLVQSVSGRTIKLMAEIGKSDSYTGGEPYTPSQGNPFYITGALSLLDAPGEYYFDKQTNLLYFYPPWNGSPDSRTLTLRGKNDIAIYTENTSFVNIKNITVYGGGILMKNTRNCVLENCKVNYAEHFYLNGIYGLNSGTRSDRMIVSGSNNRIQRCEFGPTAGNGIVLEGDDNIFTNNIVHDTSYIGFPYYGIAVKKSKRLEISHNTITDSAHSHINFTEMGVMAFDGNYHVDYERCIIRSNYFENHSTLNSDGGAFYAWGSDGGGTEIYNNFVVCGNKNNQGSFDKLRYGLYADNSTVNYVIRNNIVIGGSSGLGMNLPSRNVRINNNTIVGADHGIGMFGYPSDRADASTSFFTDNLFVNIKKEDISYSGTENGRSVNYVGNLRNGTVPAPINTQGRVQSSGNARGTVDAQYRPAGRTPDIGAIPRNGQMFVYGADWKLGERK